MFKTRRRDGSIVRNPQNRRDSNITSREVGRAKRPSFPATAVRIVGIPVNAITHVLNDAFLAVGTVQCRLPRLRWPMGVLPIGAAASAGGTTPHCSRCLFLRLALAAAKDRRRPARLSSELDGAKCAAFLDGLLGFEVGDLHDAAALVQPHRLEQIVCPRNPRLERLARGRLRSRNFMTGPTPSPPLV